MREPSHEVTAYKQSISNKIFSSKISMMDFLLLIKLENYAINLITILEVIPQTKSFESNEHTILKIFPQPLGVKSKLFRTYFGGYNEELKFSSTQLHIHFFLLKKIVLFFAYFKRFRDLIISFSCF